MGRTALAVLDSAAEAADRDADDRISTTAVLATGVVNMAHFYAICSGFPYFGYLVRDCGWAPSIDEAGFVAGLLPTALLTGRVFTTQLWGRAIDRWGTRYCLVLSMISVTLGNLAFGVATNLYAALAVRFVLLGMGNGWPTAMGLIFEEIGGRHQSLVSSRVIAIGGVVQLLGPAVAGFTYGALGPTFPALAPSLIGAALGVVGTLVALVWLPPKSPPKDLSSTAAKAAAAPPPNMWQLVLCTPMSRIVNLRALNGLVMFACFDVLPLWAIASLDAGGLALSERELGIMLSASAVAFFAYSNVYMGKLVERAGIRPSVVYCSLLSALVLQSMPFSRLLVPSAGPTGAGVVALCAALHALFQCMGVTVAVGCISGTNNEFAAYPSLKGRLNGVVSTIEAIGKLSGPLLVAPLLAALITAEPLVSPAREAPRLPANGTGPASTSAPSVLDLLGSGVFATFGAVSVILVLTAAAGGALPSSVDAQPSRKAGEAERQPVPAVPLPGTVVVELAEEAAAAKDQESGRSERV